MKSPVAYGNPAMFGPVDWNYAAGPPMRRGKSVEELGDAGWAKERERIAHLQQLQQLHQLQLQQQQVGYPGYGGVPPVQLQGPVMVPSPGDPVPAPGCPVPVHGGMMVPAGGLAPPPGHVPAPWPVQWDQVQLLQGNVSQQPPWEYNNQHQAAITDKRHQGQDVYFHPGSENGHLDVRISEWKGKHCFYQGPEDYSHQNYGKVPQEKVSNDFRTQEQYAKLDTDRRRDERYREDDRYDYERYDHRSPRDTEEYDSRDKHRYREHYDRKYSEHYESRECQYYESRTPRKHELKDRDSYSSEHEEYYDYKDTYDRRDNYRDSGHYYDHDRHHYDSRESPRYRQKEHYKRREDDLYHDERKRKDHHYDREERYDRRENSYKDRDACYQSGDETYSSKRRGHYDSEPEKHYASKDRDHYNNRYKDTSNDWRDEDYGRRKDHYRTRENYDRRTVDHADHEYENRDYPRHKARERYQDLRSLSVDSSYEESPKKDRKTHCEEWVEQQNKKLALRESHSFEDPVIYQRSDEREKGYESSASTSSKPGQKPIYVGSLDRNSFYRKTAPSSLRKSQFATTRKQNKGKHMSCEGMQSGTYEVFA